VCVRDGLILFQYIDMTVQGVCRRPTEALPAGQGLGEDVSSPDRSDGDPLEFPSPLA
jgi:hypothetical protein